MFSFLCLAVPLALMQVDADGVPLPPGVVARYGSVRYLAPHGTGRVRFLPDGRSAVSLAENVLSVWNLETGLRVREVVEAEWVCKDVSVSKDGRKLFVVGLATTGYQTPVLPATDPAGNPIDPKVKVEKTPIQRVELWTYDVATFQRTAKTVLADYRADYFWFNSFGILMIPDNVTTKRVTIVQVEPALRIVRVALGPDTPNFLYPSCDETGSRLAFANQKEIIVYDTATSKEIARYPSDSFSAALSRDGKSVYFAGRNPNNNANGGRPLELVSLDIETKKPNWTQGFPGNIYFAYLAANEPVDAFVPVMSGARSNHDIDYYDARTGKLVPLRPGESYFWRMSRISGHRSADGRRMISCVRGGLSIWDVASHKQIAPKEMTFGISENSQIQFLDVGTKLEVGPYDRNENCGQTAWDVASRKPLFGAPSHRLQEDGAATIVNRDHSDLTHELTARDRSFRVAMEPEHKDPTKPNRAIPVLSDPKTGRELRRLRPGPSLSNETQLTRNGRYLISHGFEVKSCRWDLSEADPRPLEFDLHRTGNKGWSSQQMVTVCPNQRLAAIVLLAESGSRDGELPKYEVGVHRLDTAERVLLLKGQGSLSQKTWSSNGRYLGLTVDFGLEIHDLETDVRTAPIKNVYRCSIRDDGRMICIAGDRELLFRDTLTGQVRHAIPLSGNSYTAAFAPDRRSVAHVAHDNTVHVVPLFPLAKDVPPTRAELDAAFPGLASADAKKAFLAVRLFASDPKMAVPYLREKIPPTKLPADVAATIAKLDSPQFAERTAATKRLVELGTSALGPLQVELAKTESVESRTRIEKILATHGTTSAYDLRAHRAHEVLDILGTSDSRALRDEWATGEPSILTAAARAKPRIAPFAGAESAKRTP